jgi:DNA-binding LytR/AlgR family response regulator
MEIFWTVEQEQLSGLASPDLAQPADSGMTQPEEWDEFIPANDFALVVDNRKCWMIRASDISTLEACENYTRVHLSCATALIRRPLRECERRLDPSLFFRARGDCIVNARARESNAHAHSVSTCLCAPGRPRDRCFP